MGTQRDTCGGFPVLGSLQRQEPVGIRFRAQRAFQGRHRHFHDVMHGNCFRAAFLREGRPDFLACMDDCLAVDRRQPQGEARLSPTL